MKVEVRSTLKRQPYSPERTKRFLNRAIRLARHSAGEVSVLFCGDAAMRKLNRRYRGKDRTTDVLSFPAGEDGSGFLGDLVVSEPEVRRQARAGGTAFAGVMEKLLLHGLLHLLGYDHETDRGEMDEIESHLRRRLGTAS